MLCTEEVRSAVLREESQQQQQQQQQHGSERDSGSRGLMQLPSRNGDFAPLPLPGSPAPTLLPTSACRLTFEVASKESRRLQVTCYCRYCRR